MTWLEIAAIAVAGIGVGFVNTLAGSGTLLTFPTLLAFGYPPVVATMTGSKVCTKLALGATMASKRSRSVRIWPMRVRSGPTLPPR